MVSMKECVATYRGFYACGFKRYRDYHTDVLGLWMKMVASSEASGEGYSRKMIESILKDSRQKTGDALALHSG
jgi:hypothetical protein